MSQIAARPSLASASPRRPRRDRLLSSALLPLLGAAAGALVGALVVAGPVTGASPQAGFWGLPLPLGLLLCTAGGAFAGRQARRHLERTWDRSPGRLVRAALPGAVLAGLAVSTFPALFSALPEVGVAVEQYGLRGGILLGIVLVKVALAKAWALSVPYSLCGGAVLGLLAWGVHRLTSARRNR